MTQSMETGTAPMCEHMLNAIKRYGYRRSPEDGTLLVKTCRTPTSRLGDVCGMTSPIDAERCYVCGGTEFAPAPNTIIELRTCHYRCKRCKRITRQCNATECLHCGGIKFKLLPPAITVDLYGFRIAEPPTLGEMLRRLNLHGVLERLRHTDLD